MKNKQEFDRLCKIYPLFELSIQEIEGRNDLLIAKTSNECVTYCGLSKFGRLNHEQEFGLDHEHMEKVISHELMEQFPDLHISAHGDRNGVLISVWVNRNGRDAEAIGHINILKRDLYTTLEKWAFEAHKAKNKGFFFCSGHLRAEPISDYGFFHFAGKYCKEYGDEHPDERKEAARENYD